MKVVARILSVILWVLLFFVFAITFIDFMLVKNDREPKFCINEVIVEIQGGTDYTCKGLVYKYRKISTNIYTKKSFVPFWKEAEVNEQNN